MCLINQEISIISSSGPSSVYFFQGSSSLSPKALVVYRDFFFISVSLLCALLVCYRFSLSRQAFYVPVFIFLWCILASIGALVSCFAPWTVGIGTFTSIPFFAIWTLYHPLSRTRLPFNVPALGKGFLFKPKWQE